MKNAGFSLPEMLVALAISSVLMLGAARMLPQLQRHNLRSLMIFQLQEEMQQIMATLEKAVRRAGYCAGTCEGVGLSVPDPAASCLLLSWDENSNGKWESVESEESDRYGFRLREGNLETQRGVNHCRGSGWEKLNDPATIVIDAFQVVKQARQLRLKLKGYARGWPQYPVVIDRWVTAVNL